MISLAKRLTSALPSGLDKAFFLSTGGESNEAAIKMAKVFTGKFEIVGLGASWHGMTAQALGTQYASAHLDSAMIGSLTDDVSILVAKVRGL